MCTVLLRWRPDDRWPVLLAAVRDEFVEREWDRPGGYWPAQPTVRGGRDRVGGGTWLAVDGARPVVAALLNGARLGAPADGTARPTRGTLVLAALASARVDDGAVAYGDVEHDGDIVPGIADRAALARYDGFHLLRADTRRVEIWSWDGVQARHETLPPGDHIVVNLGLDRADDPLVPHFGPLLATIDSPDPRPGRRSADAWGRWPTLLRGDGLDPTDPRALIIAHQVGDRRYGSTSASLVGLRADGGVRYDFTGTPEAPDWHEVS